MFQNFKATASPKEGPARLAKLRDVMAAENLAGFLIPRADAHQGENVPKRDERLAWLTGFTGSAGFCAALLTKAGVFIDGRYTLQIKTQVDLDHFTPVDWPKNQLGPWLIEHLPQGGRIGFDPWLHTKGEIEKLESALAGTNITVQPTTNLVDRIWADQPDPPVSPIKVHGIEFSGVSSADKRHSIAAELQKQAQHATILTLPDSIAWLLNIRGSDIERTPVVLGFAILYDDARLEFFTDPAKAGKDVKDHLGPDVRLLPETEFGNAIDALCGPVRLDKATAPIWVYQRLRAGNTEVTFAPDPCILPKARKSSVEINGARQAHLRDAVAMAELLAWLAAQTPQSGFDEINVVKKLETLRASSNLLADISFDTICGSGPNGAITHYRVTENSNRRIQTGDLLLVDSGGQYQDGTTDITRTIAIGTPTEEQKSCFSRVLQGMIAISMLRWPSGLAGRDLDPIARRPLWAAGLDYDHGTGHGVGSFLGVHEGPQRLSRVSDVPFETGMILSNEPGYYREGEFGIRIENLIVVEPASQLGQADQRDMLQFETLTFTPIDRNLINSEMLNADERAWLNRYHTETYEKIAAKCSPATQEWLKQACAPI